MSAFLATALPAGAATVEVDDIGDDIVLDFRRQTNGLQPQAALVVPFVDAYDADPTGLLAFAGFTRMFTDRDETWDVWICRDPAEESLGLELGGVVATLNTTAADYYDLISGGIYRPVFRGAGTSSATTCGINQTHTGTTPRIYVNDFTALVANRNSVVGQAGPGTVSLLGTSLSYEGLQRRAEIDGAAVSVVSAYEFSPAASIAAHEIGHTLHWAHAGAIGNYDNELDLMSLGWGGTHGFNLYSSGWIAPEQVALHHGGDKSYTVGPIGSAGTRMVAITTGTEGLFYALSVRGPDDPVLDANSSSGVTELGVEVYLVDQRPGSCPPLPAAAPCFGILADITPYPAQPAPFPEPYPQFHTAGDTFSIAGVPVTVGTADAESLSVRVNGGLTGSGWFLDDDSSVFEANIEWVAIEGITRGCNPPRGDFFCPGDPVTRGQMAAFLVRALNLRGSSADAFGDDESSVFENDINALAASGITTGCTPTAFCPNAEVTRGQMAAFLKRAYTIPASAVDAFGDDESSVFENDINALAASGITTGCTATAFCPDANVSRGQMAAFLNRSG